MMWVNLCRGRLVTLITKTSWKLVSELAGRCEIWSSKWLLYYWPLVHISDVWRYTIMKVNFDVSSLHIVVYPVLSQDVWILLRRLSLFLHAKQFPLPVDIRGMTDREKDIIAVVWNDLVLRKQLEDDPYSLSKNDLKLLELNDAFNKKLTEINDQLQASKRQQAIKAYLQ